VGRHFLTFFGSNSPLVLEIRLISDEDARNVVVWRIFLRLRHPGVHSVETVPVGDVVSNNDTVGTLVVARRDCLKTLLTGSIPDLQFADLIIAVDRSNFEVDTDCWHEIFLELIVLSKRYQSALCADK